MRITTLEPQATNPERINVYVDGQFLLGANAKVVLQMGLELEQELDATHIEQLRNEEAIQRAIDRVYNYISYRPRSREEVRRYLHRKETPPEIIETILSRLDHLNLINDHAFASFWVENRAQFSPRGTRAIKNELRMKGVGRDTIDETVDEEQDEDLALRAGRKKALALLRLPKMDYATFRTRLGSFLQRRGFGYEITTQTVRKLWQELGRDSSDFPSHIEEKCEDEQ